MTNPTPSPLPWSVDAMGYIRAADNTNVLEVKENAEFVCHSVNRVPLFEELLDLLKRCHVTFVIHEKQFDVGDMGRNKEISDLIARAEEDSK